MTESDRLRRAIEDVREHVSPAWGDGRAMRWAELTAARGRRKKLQRAGGVALAVAATFGLVWLARPGVPTPAPGAPVIAVTTPRPAASVLRLADGSVVTPLDADSEVIVSRMSSDEIELVLVRGAARFEVTPGLPRAFRVRAGAVAVSVVGTVFTLRREGSAVDVEVDHGRVRVEWEPEGRVEIGAGERGLYPPPSGERSSEGAPSESTPVEATPTEAARPAQAPVETEAPRAGAVAPPSARSRRATTTTPAASSSSPPAQAAAIDAAPEWRALAEHGRYDEGYGLLLLDPGVLRGRDVDALILAADCARLSGHPAESLAYLRRALAIGRDDARAPVVAFTLGRVLLQQLSRPAEAADAFALARELAPEGVLAQDALAREVEASHEAGLRDRARARALDYLRAYPGDLRTDAVRRLGGLD